VLRYLRGIATTFPASQADVFDTLSHLNASCLASSSRGWALLIRDALCKPIHSHAGVIVSASRASVVLASHLPRGDACDIVAAHLAILTQQPGVRIPQCACLPRRRDQRSLCNRHALLRQIVGAVPQLCRRLRDTKRRPGGGTTSHAPPSAEQTHACRDTTQTPPCDRDMLAPAIAALQFFVHVRLPRPGFVRTLVWAVESLWAARAVAMLVQLLPPQALPQRPCLDLKTLAAFSSAFLQLVVGALRGCTLAETERAFARESTASMRWSAVVRVLVRALFLLHSSGGTGSTDNEKTRGTAAVAARLLRVFRDSFAGKRAAGGASGGGGRSRSDSAAGSADLPLTPAPVVMAWYLCAQEAAAAGQFVLSRAVFLMCAHELKARAGGLSVCGPRLENLARLQGALAASSTCSRLVARETNAFILSQAVLTLRERISAQVAAFSRGSRVSALGRATDPEHASHHHHHHHTFVQFRHCQGADGLSHLASSRAFAHATVLAVSSSAMLQLGARVHAPSCAKEYAEAATCLHTLCDTLRTMHTARVSRQLTNGSPPSTPPKLAQQRMCSAVPGVVQLVEVAALICSNASSVLSVLHSSGVDAAGHDMKVAHRRLLSWLARCSDRDSPCGLAAARSCSTDPPDHASTWCCSCFCCARKQQVAIGVCQQLVAVGAAGCLVDEAPEAPCVRLVQSSAAACVTLLAEACALPPSATVSLLLVPATERA